MRITKIALFVFLGVLLSSCSTSVPAEMRAMMVGTEDIPAEWIIFKESTGKDWGGQLYNIAFAYGNESESPALEQQLIVYADAAAALDGFEEYKGYMYVEGWSVPPEVNFSPITLEDKFEYKCMDQEIDHVLTKICFILQQHKNYVSALGVHMGDPVTFDVLNSVLKSIDEKLNK
ncbi:MAG: hypothetical protein HYU84_07670 [Chloroflexi bacterium]|nr:hypothetical protein [Chloroflexota bacterium]MBI3169814.1 hypothetical protein [Chloroflexota bacterium]